MAYYLTRLNKQARKRERAKKRLEKAAAAVERNQCGFKIQHENFWEAMCHAGQLCRDTRVLYYAYHCETCGFAHVGHSDNPTLTWMYEGYSETFPTKLA